MTFGPWRGAFVAGALLVGFCAAPPVRGEEAVERIDETIRARALRGVVTWNERAVVVAVRMDDKAAELVLELHGA